MKAILAALVVLVVCAAPARAQTGGILGTVKDESGRGVKGATIAIERAEYPARFLATSDKKGRFTFLGLQAGEWFLSVDVPGFEPAGTRIRVRALQNIRGIEIRLLPAAAPASIGGMTAGEIQQRIDAAEASASGGDLDAAVTAYSDLLARVPALTAIYLRIGALQERKGDVAAALTAYRRLARIDPQNVKARAAVERLTR